MTIITKFPRVPKIAFSKGVNPCFGQKMPFFFVYVDLVRIRLKIMLSDFAQEKETFLTTKNNFSKSKNFAFSKWLTHAFGQKMPFFLYLHLMKIRLEIMLGDFAGKKNLF